MLIGSRPKSFKWICIIIGPVHVIEFDGGKGRELRAAGFYLLLYFLHDHIINITFINTCHSMLPQPIIENKNCAFKLFIILTSKSMYNFSTYFHTYLIVYYIFLVFIYQNSLIYTKTIFDGKKLYIYI